MRGRRSWRDSRLVVVDLETTGLDPAVDEIVSFGAVPVDRGRVIAAESLYGLVRPAQELPPRSIEIHGIRPQELIEAPAAPEALRPLAEVLAGRPLIAHAAWVERSFLAAPMRKLRVRLPRRLVDTAMLWRLLCIDRGEPDPGYVGLSDLAEGLGLPVHTPHHALGDALTTGQVFLALATHLESSGRRSVRALERADGPVRTHASLYGVGKRI